jgi:hypothetical protein
MSFPIGNRTFEYGFSGISEIPFAYPLGGVFGFEDITSLTFQTSKVSIDSATGIITFQKYINVGIYNLIINYVYNGNKNVYSYKLVIIPHLVYTISGTSLMYNNYVSISSVLPIINPSTGLFYFSDFSNNPPINININKNTGIITFNNNIFVNNYNIGVTYSVYNLINIKPYYLTILPKFYYVNNYNIITYNTAYNSKKPITDPSGGIIYIVKLEPNLINNVTVNINTGIISLNKYINVGSYSINVYYNYKNIVASTTTFITIIHMCLLMHLSQQRNYVLPVLCKGFVKLRSLAA